VEDADANNGGAKRKADDMTAATAVDGPVDSGASEPATKKSKDAETTT
jgi:hypothetical protein